MRVVRLVSMHVIPAMRHRSAGRHPDTRHDPEHVEHDDCPARRLEAPIRGMALEPHRKPDAAVEETVEQRERHTPRPASAKNNVLSAAAPMTACARPKNRIGGQRNHTGARRNSCRKRQVRFSAIADVFNAAPHCPGSILFPIVWPAYISTVN